MEENISRVAGFKLKKQFPDGRMDDLKSRFPFPCALAATFNERLIGNVAQFYAKEVLSEGVKNISDVCVSFFGEDGLDAYSFGTGILREKCAKAFARGIERGGLKAFPVVTYGSKECEGFLTSNTTSGLAVCFEDAITVDFMRFKGVIYGKGIKQPCEVSSKEGGKEVKTNTERLIDLGVPTSAFYTEKSLAAASEKQLKAFNKKIGALGEVVKSPIKPLEFQADETHKYLFDYALESIVMLKNDGYLLPLSSEYKKFGVIGKSGGSLFPFGGDSIHSENCLHAIKKVYGVKTKVNYLPIELETGFTDEEYNSALEFAKASDVAIFFVDAGAYGENISYNSRRLKRLVDEVASIKTTVAVIFGAPTDVSPFESASSILLGWYSGGYNARQIVNVICGSYPMGKLPYRIIKSVDDNGNKKYYPFGYGMCFCMDSVLGARINRGQIDVYVRNRDLNEIRVCLQVYCEEDGDVKLIAFKKLTIDTLERRIVHLRVPEEYLSKRLFISDKGADADYANVIEVSK